MNCPSVLHRTREDFHGNVEPRKDILQRLEADAKKLAGDPREILLCFACDPYPIGYEGLHWDTRHALRILGDNGLKATVLTKSTGAEMDFDLFEFYGFSLGVSVIWSLNGESFRKKYEPGAASIAGRVELLHSAKTNDIKTWVSMEPIIEPVQALKFIRDHHRYVDYWKVGKINHDKELEAAVDWAKFYIDVTTLLDSLGADYYIKESLRKFVPKAERNGE